MCALLKKVRYIQPYKADFNFFQQIIFGKEATNVLTNNGFFSKEHFNKKGSTAEDAKFDKISTEELSRQARHPMATVSVNAAQYHDRVNHMIMALIRYAPVGKLGPIAIFLTCL